MVYIKKQIKLKNKHTIYICTYTTIFLLIFIMFEYVFNLRSYPLLSVFAITVCVYTRSNRNEN